MGSVPFSREFAGAAFTYPTRDHNVSYGQQFGEPGQPYEHTAAGGYYAETGAVAPGTPPPEVISWNVANVNNVSIIGNAGIDPEIRHFQSGNCVARVSIALRKGNVQQQQEGMEGGMGEQDDKAMWVNVEAWNEQAKQMVEHVRKGNQICVLGRIKVDSWADKETGAPRTATKIVANHIYFVERGQPNVYQQGMQGMAAGGIEGAQYNSYNTNDQGGTQQPVSNSVPQHAQDTSPKEELWLDLQRNPDAWWDNRQQKANGERSPRFPDFKHKENDTPLWIESNDTPAWVHDSLGATAAAAAVGSGFEANANAGGDPYYGQQQQQGGYQQQYQGGYQEPDYSRPYGEQQPAYGQEQQQHWGDYGTVQPNQSHGTGADIKYQPAKEFDDDPPF